jgi:hypothetical protein
MLPSERIRRFWKDWEGSAYRAAVLSEYFLHASGVSPRDETDAGRELKRLQGHLRRYEGHYYPRDLHIRRKVMRSVIEGRV